MHSPLLTICVTFVLLQTTVAVGQENSTSSTPALPSEIKLIEKFDQNGDQRLDAKERKAARSYLAKLPTPGTNQGTTGRPEPTLTQGVAVEVTKKGLSVLPNGVETYANLSLYDIGALRTVFLNFEGPDWEGELADFARTDVTIPADFSMDGQSIPGIGVRFCEATETPLTSKGYKRSLALQLNHTQRDASIGSQTELRLIDASTDPTFSRALLYSFVSRQFIPTPQTNFVRVVINGESWGIYVSIQPFDDNFVREKFPGESGARWFAPGRSALAYLGEDPAAYRQAYHLLSADNPDAWIALRDLCKILAHTPAREIEGPLSERLDLDGALKFLALQNVLINQSGYGGESGGYGILLGQDGRFRLIPQAMEASFRLIEKSEVEMIEQRKRTADAKSKKDREVAGDQLDEKDARLIDRYTHQNFPQQTITDLAMMLSYSFVNKADSDFNGSVSNEEWMHFARAWFMVMDEDLTGSLTRDQFITKFRDLITPVSGLDGRTKQTFGKDDAAAAIGGDFFSAMDKDRNGRLTSSEVNAAFTEWYPAWRDPKSKVITEVGLQRGFNHLFSRTTFHADQTFITPQSSAPDPELDRKGNDRRALGINLPRFGGKRKDQNSKVRTLITFHEQLDPMDGNYEPTRPLLAKILANDQLRARYLQYVREITQTWLSWTKLSPLAGQARQLISNDVEKETHKANSYIQFVQQFDQDPTPGPRSGEPSASLKDFVTERRLYLLKDDRVTGMNPGP